MSVISIILVLIIAFLAGLDGILDQFQFHQPLVSCTLIGLASGHTVAGIMLGGTLQFLALGWANIGAAVAPDVALASTAAAVIMIKGGDFSQKRYYHCLWCCSPSCYCRSCTNNGGTRYFNWYRPWSRCCRKEW